MSSFTNRRQESGGWLKTAKRLIKSSKPLWNSRHAGIIKRRQYLSMCWFYYCSLLYIYFFTKILVPLTTPLIHYNTDLLGGKCFNKCWYFKNMIWCEVCQVLIIKLKVFFSFPHIFMTNVILRNDTANWSQTWRSHKVITPSTNKAWLPEGAASHLPVCYAEDCRSGQNSPSCSVQTLWHNHAPYFHCQKLLVCP